MKIVIADRGLLPHRTVLESRLPHHAVTSWHDGVDERTLATDLADADVYVGARFTAAMGEAARGLRLVHAPGAGYDGIDATALPVGATVANTFHHEGSIAEYIAMALVALRRRVREQDTALRRGSWLSSTYDRDIAQPATLRGSTVVFLGFGHIGQAAWSLLRAYGAEGIAITRSGSVDAAASGLAWAGTNNRLLEAVEQADALVVSIPLSPETTGAVGARELDALGPDGLLVNVARGPVVDEKALFAALDSRSIAGAAIDVWYRYPGSDGVGEPASLPFGDLDNVLMTPHSSGVTSETFVGRAIEIADNISRLAAGESIRNVVTPA
jgi:phosphoglycerate dehydrogenase-like enzyme